MEKEFKTIDEQIEILKLRNVLIEDYNIAYKILSKNNYYYLINGYKNLFIDKTKNIEKYLNNTKIEEILVKREGDEGMLHAQMVIRRDFERAKEEGRKEGMLHAQEVIRRDFEKAKEEGREEGRKEGRKEGSLKNAIEVAKNMLKENFDVDLISRLTGLKKEQFMQ